ncbi:PD-(D/E)XK nuclease family protein [Bacillus sp. JJ1521]|uniref:PD-(D/E)XK nuclease family protein n=1 Tax=Bacillus sp. JJ1521 TaxID=3122957 RepID=UPI003000DA49
MKRVNLFKELGITYKEDIISNFLVTLLNQSSYFRESFLTRFLGIEEPRCFEVTTYTRIYTSVGIPDMISVIQNEEQCYLLLVENKLKADEGYQQTMRYASETCITEIKQKLNIKHEHVQVKLLFLTLVPETIPTSPVFSNISYEQLIKEIPPSIEDSGLNMLYEDFTSVLIDFYKDLDVTDNDLLFEKFTEETEAERLKIRFRKLMDSISLDGTMLTRSPIGQVVGAGRINYLVQFSKDSWKGEKVKKDEKGTYIVSGNTFDIHIECTFDVFNQTFTLPLHYETRPYLTKKQLKNAIGYDYYLKQRDEIKTVIHKKIKEQNDTILSPYNGSNQIAYTKMLLTEETTVKEFKEQLIRRVEKITEVVDSALEEWKRG